MDCAYVYAYGSDLILGVEKQENGTQRFLAIRFDAALNTWTNEGVPYAESVSGLEDICVPYVISVYAVLGRAVFMRQPDERWTNIGSLPEESELSTVRMDPGGAYLLYCVPQANLVY